MYMYYFLAFELDQRVSDQDKKEENTYRLALNKKAANTYLLALDGDVDFEPKAVHSLVDYMKVDDDIAAACGRIHPKGLGMA